MPISFRTGPVRVRTPATSANLGPGFDALGLALTMYDEVTAELVDGETAVDVAGEGAGALPTGEDHLIVRAMRVTFDRLGEQPALKGIRLRCVNAIPQARGLGSSSAAIVAGVTLAQALAATSAEEARDGASRAVALEIAGELEGHPDNVAPCILGGFTIAWQQAAGPAPQQAAAPRTGRENSPEAHGQDPDKQERAKAVSVRPSGEIEPVVFVPPTQGLTAIARAALPEEVPHVDAAFNAGRSALLVQALTRDPSLLMAATEDRLHQNYRAAGMPETAELVRRLRENGIAAVVSGAGPTVLALTTGAQRREMPEIMPPGGWVRHNLRFDLVGAVVVE